MMLLDETNTKGCNDNLSTTYNCRVLSETCMERGGRAQCETCTTDFCNSSASSSFTTIITMAIFTVLAAFNIVA